MRLHGFALLQANAAADRNGGCIQTDIFDSGTCRCRHLKESKGLEVPPVWSEHTDWGRDGAGLSNAGLCDIPNNRGPPIEVASPR